jgi:DNA primase
MGYDRGSQAKLVKEASDIVAVIGSYLALTPAGSLYKGLCPFHHDSRPSLTVDPKWQNFRCWACGKHGDVFTFVQEFEKLDFREALHLLANRAGIKLDESDPGPSRAHLYEVVRWAAEQYHQCLLDDVLAESARHYLGQRGLTGKTVRGYTLGYAPASGDWLLTQASKAAGITLQTLEEVGLIARRSGPARRAGSDYYDRFRDRIIFPIRDARGQVVGFGGRVLPGTAAAQRGPKYYNSADTPLFCKSELLYGLDRAREAAAQAGYLALVEGYTDVLMAHQCGVLPVVATMGTALNSKHVQQLRRFTQRVILVFDADAGGATGVERALEILLRHEIDLAIATLPEGMDPCDLILREGPEAFRQVLANAVDALTYQLQRLLRDERNQGVAGRQRVIDSILGLVVTNLASGSDEQRVKEELILAQLANTMDLPHSVVRDRLTQLRQAKAAGPASAAAERSPASQPLPLPQTPPPADQPPRQGDAASQYPRRPAPTHERELLELLLAHPSYLPEAMGLIAVDELTHPIGRQLYQMLGELHARGEPADVDGLRLAGCEPALVRKAMSLREVGLHNQAPGDWLTRIAAAFARQRAKRTQLEVQKHLQAADHASAVELLKRIQQVGRVAGPPGSTTGG